MEGATALPDFLMADADLKPYTGPFDEALKKRY
jgi:hypothetical protein